jgi:hypothetical protein
MENGIGDGALILDREPNDLRFLDGAVGRFLCSRDDEITDTAALQFGGSLDDGQRVGGDTRLKAGGAVSLRRHGEPQSRRYVRGSPGHIK